MKNPNPKFILCILFLLLNFLTLFAQMDFSVSGAVNTFLNTLTKEQQQILDSQINSDKSTYIDAETLFDTLKSKYEL